jgi:hypothetical protein
MHLPSLEGKSFNARQRVELALNTVFVVPVRQKNGVGSCFATAPLIFVQDEDPAKMMEMLAGILCDGGIEYHTSRNGKSKMPTNLLGGTENSEARDLHYAMVRTLADAYIMHGQGEAAYFPSMEMHMVIADLKIQEFIHERCQEKGISHSGTVGNGDLECNTSPYKEMLAIAIRLRKCCHSLSNIHYTDLCDRRIWCAPSARNVNGVDESLGVYVPCSESDGQIKPMTREDCNMALVGIKSDIYKLLNDSSSADLRNEKMIALYKAIPDEVEEISAPSGGVGLQITQSIYGSTLGKVSLVANSKVSADIVFSKWFKLAQETYQSAGQLIRILASGPSHCYTINFTLSQLVFENMDKDASYFLTHLQKNSTEVIAFIDTNWMDAATGEGTVLEIRWNPGKMGKRTKNTAKQQFEFVRRRDGKWEPFQDSDFLDRNLAIIQ